MQKIIQHSIIWAGILLLLSYQQQLIKTMHYHQLPSGVLVKHAHPYNKTSKPAEGSENHTHKSNEILLFSFFDGHLAPDANPVEFAEIINHSPDCKFYNTSAAPVIRELYKFNEHRGPPRC
ncbi:MAG: hypothetical protein CVU09_08375 [Bacteroidetes bacterium HGW-Bacteroidetes-4]|jgi:hypothetical protein|nr:MAG: hypothetical protein CVU09_08375 [Bacteroidetes bacterium HGW-Bacteroidetes-4]